jgi:peptide deformylase
VSAILQDGAPELRTVCAPVTEFGKALAPLLRRLVDAADSARTPTLRAAGLAANQIGECVRVILIEDGGRTIMVNPAIVQRWGEQRVSDGGLSVDEGRRRATTVRAAEILVTYQDAQGNARRQRCKGFRAAVIQHEVDHLDGILFTDLVKPPEAP